MKRFLSRRFFRRSLGMGLGATTSVLLAGCSIEHLTPEVCEPGASQRAAKCPPQTSPASRVGYGSGGDY